jgi:ATP adenylyltransferase
MRRLFSPWRRPYVLREHSANDTGCVFCAAIQNPDDFENFMIFRGRNAFVMVNRYPYTSGHVMVLPYLHVARLHEVDQETRAEMMELMNHATEAIGRAYQPGGFNLGANLGAAAGAGIEAHLHIHVVPRWSGDTNFISSVGDTRVLPEALEDTWQRIRDAW